MKTVNPFERHSDESARMDHQSESYDETPVDEQEPEWQHYAAVVGEGQTLFCAYPCVSVCIHYSCVSP